MLRTSRSFERGRMKRYYSTADMPGSLITDGLVGRWQGNGNANNLLGIDNGAWYGTPTYHTLTGGEIANADGNKCFQLDGSSGIKIPDSSNLRVSNLTASIWFNWDGSWPGTFVTVFGKSLKTTTFDSWTVWLDSSEQIYSGTTSAGYNWKYLSAPLFPDENTWHHLFVTYDDSIGALELFYDNTSAGTVSADSIFYDAAYVGLGICYENGADNSGKFKGLLYDFRMYNRVLNSTERGQIYAGAA